MTDRDALRSMLETPGWAIVAVEIERSLTYRRARLEDCKTWDEVQQHRGAIEALTGVLSHIDQQIREEIDADEPDH